MRLARLAPEALRLRRLCRAHASGEVSRAEYRAARRNIINELAVQFSSDPTEDATLRRFADAAAAVPQAEEVIREPVPLRTLVLAALLLVLASVSALADVIPPVAERDPNPQASARVAVSGVRVEHEGQLDQVSGEAVQRLTDETLAAIRAADAPADHGFSQSELEEIGRFLRAVGVHEPDHELTLEDSQDLAALIDGQKRRRGVSVSQLEQLAEVVEAHYRSAGYFLAEAFLPAQQIQDGVAVVKVLPGVLSVVAVQGEAPTLAREAFADLLGRPVVRDEVESRMLQLNDMPAFSSQASFAPGSGVGDTRLDLAVAQPAATGFAIGADSYGRDEVGEGRVTSEFVWRNPLGRADRLRLGAVVHDESDNVAGYAEYATPLADHRNLARVQLAVGRYAWDGSRPLDGDSVLAEATLRRSLLRSRTRDLSAEVAGGYHRLGWDDGRDQNVGFVRLGAAAHQIWDAPLRVSASLDADLLAGHTSDVFAGQSSSWWQLVTRADVWMPVQLPFLGGEQKLAFNLSGQYADDRLPSSLRQGLGGPFDVRGFEPGTFMADRAAALGVALHVPVPVGELVWHLDAAYGEDLSEGQHRWAQLTSTGISLRVRLGEHLASQLGWSLPVTTKQTGGLDEDSGRLFWSLQYVH